MTHHPKERPNALNRRALLLRGAGAAAAPALRSRNPRLLREFNRSFGWWVI